MLKKLCGVLTVALIMLFAITALAMGEVSVNGVKSTDNGITVSVTANEAVSDVQLFAVSYEGGIIKSVKLSDKVTLTEGATENIEIIGAGESDKIYVWGEDMAPLCEVYMSEGDNPTDEPEATAEPVGDGIIHLLGDSINADGVENVTVDGTTVTITAAGEYTIEGTLDDGQIAVASSNKKDEIIINLNDVTVTNSTRAPFSATKGKVTLLLSGTNTFNDTDSQENAATRDKGCITSKNDLTIKSQNGAEGTLVVNGNFENGIHCKADLEIGNVNLTVNAQKTGIKSNDSVKFTKKALNINITSGSDAIKTDYVPIITTDSTTGETVVEGGTITVNGGTFNIVTETYTDPDTAEVSSGDGIQADLLVEIANSPVINITSTGEGIKASASTADETEPACEGGNGCVVISGGTVTIDAGEDGIKATKDITVSKGTVNVTAAEDGVQAGDTEKVTADSTTTETVNVAGSVTVTGGTLNIVKSGDDAIVSSGEITVAGGTVKGTATCDFIKAYDLVTISDGTIGIISGNDGIQSGKALVETVSGSTTTDSDYTEGNINITGGTIGIISGGGSTATVTDSAKGIKANSELNISGGDITIDSADDAIHSNYNVTVTGGALNLATADDGLHADYTLTLGTEENAAAEVYDDFYIDISTSYEGLEGSVINVLSGTTYLVSSDDGVNAAGEYSEDGTLKTSSDTMSVMAGPGQGSNPGGGSGNFGPGGGMQDDSAPYGMLYIKGGKLYCEVNGDGIDSNGSVAMSGGIVMVNGPTNGGNGVFDKGDGGDCTFTVTGGTLVGIGNNDMADPPTVTGQGYYTTSSSSGGGRPGQSGSSVSGKAGALLKITIGSESMLIVPKTSWNYVFVTTPDMTTGTSYSTTTLSSYSGGTEILGKTINNTFYGLKANIN